MIPNCKILVLFTSPSQHIHHPIILFFQPCFSFFFNFQKLPNFNHLWICREHLFVIHILFGTNYQQLFIPDCFPLQLWVWRLCWLGWRLFCCTFLLFIDLYNLFQGFYLRFYALFWRNWKTITRYTYLFLLKYTNFIPILVDLVHIALNIKYLCLDRIELINFWNVRFFWIQLSNMIHSNINLFWIYIEVHLIYSAFILLYNISILSFLF